MNTLPRLTYETLRAQGFDEYLLDDGPERVLQFGDGNFLRGFVDCFIDQLNEHTGFNSKVVVVQPAAPKLNPTLNEQDGLYTLLLRGRENGQKVSRQRVVSCLSRCLNASEQWRDVLACAANPHLRLIVSNTTEAGIVFDPTCTPDDAPPRSFPAKLTSFLYARYALNLPGFLILPCELTDHNGRELTHCIESYIDLWGLGDDFCRWFREENVICETLVDRIITGYPKAEADALCNEFGYEDRMITTGEPFAFWVIEAPSGDPENGAKPAPAEVLEAEFGRFVRQLDLPILITDDHVPYKQRKVRILNGAHTSMVLGAYLTGQEIVRGCMENDTLRSFMNRAIYDEIIPTLDLPLDELAGFAASVEERFNNPYIDHSLLAISLNSTSKWKGRLMPSLLEYVARKGKLPPLLTFAFAAYIAFYHTAKERDENGLVGVRTLHDPAPGHAPASSDPAALTNTYTIKDDAWVLDFYYDHRSDSTAEIAHAVIHNDRMWGEPASATAGAASDAADAVLNPLAALPGFEAAVVSALERIETAGMAAAFEEVLNGASKSAQAESASAPSGLSTIQIHPFDNVAVALRDLTAEEGSIPRGHKFALRKISAGEPVVKYGCAIGIATQDIFPGQWVHTHNVRTGLSESAEYRYEPVTQSAPGTPPAPRTFNGFRRSDGRAATRNELWIIPTVGCVNTTAQQLVQANQHLVTGSVEGLYTFPHPFGCSQMGDDHALTRKILAALVNHPNAAGVLVLGLGCENLTMEQFKAQLGQWDDDRVKFLVCQESSDEIAEGSELLRQLAGYAAQFERQPIPASELIIGMKCGGSDGLSGITANPAVGRFSDRLIALGGTTILTEVPEMFGAESILFNRCADRHVFHRAVKMVEDFKGYFTAHGQVVYENPSPGNKAGGITTLEDKSCGCVQKGGTAPIVDVLAHGDAVTRRGLNLLSGPGNDLVSSTVLTAAGAHAILFTTGRGTPFGAPVPTVKISTNTALYEKKPGWIDFNAGTVATGESLDDAGARLLDYVLEVAGGRQTNNEKRGAREISIFKDGVVL